MSDSTTIILNICTMICLIAFAGGINAELAEMKIGLVKRILQSIFTLSLKPIREIKAHWTILLCYPLVVVLLGQFLTIMRQFRIGKMYIRADISFATQFATWILVPAIILGMINLHKRNNKTE